MQSVTKVTHPVPDARGGLWQQAARSEARFESLVAVSTKETLACIGRDVHSRRLRALQKFPVVAEGGAVMQLALVLDRPPGRVLGGDQQRDSLVDLRKIGTHRFDDG